MARRRERTIPPVSVPWLTNWQREVVPDMARKRNQRRDRLGRFSGAGTKIASTAKGARTATKAATKTGAKTVATGIGNSYVPGSFSQNIAVGQSGEYKRIRVGAEFKTPKGRGVVVKGVVGFHGKPNRRFDIKPSLDVQQKKLTFTSKPNPSRGAAAGTKLKR
ncbi:hypothetical protein [Rhodococcus sp. ARP2]|uniref:hypothetical protein n=1 Tax=Rhodococcus sp. ARP2 TaxID=1661385 RepID=UPI001CB94AFB|nr:hypothetical protein [Rhodococcus sp. ARP2]